MIHGNNIFSYYINGIYIYYYFSFNLSTDRHSLSSLLLIKKDMQNFSLPVLHISRYLFTVTRSQIIYANVFNTFTSASISSGELYNASVGRTELSYPKCLNTGCAQ